MQEVDKSSIVSHLVRGPIGALHRRHRFLIVRLERRNAPMGLHPYGMHGDAVDGVEG